MSELWKRAIISSLLMAGLILADVLLWLGMVIAYILGQWVESTPREGEKQADER